MLLEAWDMFWKHVKQKLLQLFFAFKNLLQKRSLVFQLTGLYAVIIFIVFIVINTILYFTLDYSIYKQEKQALSEKYQIINTVFQTNIASDDIFIRQLKLIADADKHFFIHITDQNQKPIFLTPDLDHHYARANFPALQVNDKASFKISKCSTCKKSALLLTGWLQNPALNSLCEIQIAKSTHAEEELLEDYWEILNYIAIAGILVAIVIGWWLARLSMRPLNSIIKVIDQISIQKLDERITYQNWPKELTVLAQKLNLMFVKLEEAFNRLTQFSADLAHELRTPLNNLRISTETALLKSRTANEYQNILSSNLEEYERLTRIIDGTLFLAKAEIPQNTLSFSLINVHELVTAVFEFYLPIAEEQSVKMSCDGAAMLWADKLLLERILHNLFSNALRYTSAGDKIHVQIKSTDKKTIIIFSDTGSGIAPEHLPYVFNRFYRADSSRSLHSGGTGLGLAIVKTIMELHHGTVTIASEIDKGTTVELTFRSQK